jgi:hypothetical protein
MHHAHTTEERLPCNTARRQERLQQLLPLWPREIADNSPGNRQRIVRLLARALREERRRGASGHWTYDLSRHAALAQLYRQECEDLNICLRGHRPCTL